VLEPQSRAALTEQLKPPPGFELSHAVGTTFTLDLATALAVPLSFASQRLSTDDTLGVLDAIRRAADRVDVFAQAGEISMGVRSDLVAFLEPMIHPVAPRRGLFHPKVWFLEYCAGDLTSYRFLCASRNLTGDRSWDVVVRLDGVPASAGSKRDAEPINAPLVRLLRDLASWGVHPLSAERSSRILALAGRWRTVAWELPSAAVETFDEGPLSHPELARMAAHSPGNIAWRALRSVAGRNVTAEGLWTAAFTLVDGLRSLFNRTESTALLVTLYGDQPYWRSVLDYCADGNLQAVMDEYLYQLLLETGNDEVDDAGLLALARRAAESMELRPARYVARDNSPERAEIPMMARFALRYGGKYATESDDSTGVRQGEVRAAFNSTFAPFVLASTSVGQEGIDFHWWSHSVVHWNLPSNPVDFEQREGRVNRFAGHAVRKNVVQQHWGDVLASDDARAWRAAFDAAAATDNGLGEFSPWWVYPGTARIHRVLAHYPLSRDIAKYERLRSALTLYRLTLGQPRQEDMVDMLAKRGIDGASVPTIDLRPPRSVTPVGAKP
jgi:hypothetical protein